MQNKHKQNSGLTAVPGSTPVFEKPEFALKPATGGSSHLRAALC